MLLFLLACTTASTGGGGGGDDGGTSTDGGASTDGGVPETYEVALSGPAVIDSLHTGEATFDLDLLDGEPDRIKVTVRSDVGGLLATLSSNAEPGELTWDLRSDGGMPVGAGNYSLRAEAFVANESVATATIDVSVITIGLLSGTLGGDDRIALMWHMAGGPGMYWDDGAIEPTFVLDAVADELGEAVDVPEPWDDVYEPPEGDTGWNLPAAYPAPARPELTLSVAGEWEAAADSLGVSIDGWDLVSGSLADGTLTFLKSEPLAAGPRVVEDGLDVNWTADGEVFSSQHLPLRIYAVYGPPTFDVSGPPYMPWVAVIDPALRAIDGVDDDADAVASALVEHIYEDYGLTYDTRYGASVYVSYGGGGYNGATMDLTAFVDLRNGLTVNCSDCAGILSAYANMVGVELDYSIISSNFSLNRIKAIGQSEYTNCPFGPGGCGFSYHAVTTSDGSQTIWDATLKLDGDSDPYTAPSTEMWVEAVSGEEYLDRLVYSGDPRYAYEQKGYLK